MPPRLCKPAPVHPRSDHHDAGAGCELAGLKGNSEHILLKWKLRVAQHLAPGRRVLLHAGRVGKGGKRGTVGMFHQDDLCVLVGESSCVFVRKLLSVTYKFV